MTIQSFIEDMPKVELHVHLEGAIQPATILQLATKNKIELPSKHTKGLSQWMQFSKLEYFFEVYAKICECIQTTEDIEYIAREFLKGQKAQNILYSEVTYTGATQWFDKGITYKDQIKAINRAKLWAEKELGVSMNLIIDIPRNFTPEEGVEIAHNVINCQSLGVVGLGLGGNERDYPPEIFQKAFDLIQNTNIRSIPHAGEMAGPKSIWGALNILNAKRIGHGMRCIEDANLMNYLKNHHIMIDVNPTSNVCLKIYDQIQNHPINKLIQAGLEVSINSDDPALFSTSLTNEFSQLEQIFGYKEDMF